MQLKNRLDPAYEKGVKEFLDFAYVNRDPQSKIPCPCISCNNFLDQTREVIEDHMFIRGVVKTYVRWIFHGEGLEDSSSDDDCETDTHEENHENTSMHEMINDIAFGQMGHEWGGREDSISQGSHIPNKKENFFLRMLGDAEQELYPGCKKYSKLSFIVKLLHLKTMNRWSDKSFNMLIELLKDALPIGETLPGSYYEAKKIVRDLGLDYVKIHACVYDCALFWKAFQDLDTCPKCNTSRWKFEGSKKIPQKVLRYFPLKPRLQRLFVNKAIACDMKWHKEKRVNEENIMRHPADSESWKEFDKIHESFAQDPRNVRLGLASDGFNPFGNMSNAYSIWPVFLVPYNLPPWKCMKDPFFIMSMLIPGPNAPGNDIDVYLQPLIKELKDLWEDGIETFDAHTEQMFQLRAAVLWTINDFPAYANLSG